jgi:hypothetical protein
MLSAAITPMDDFLVGFIIGFLDLYGQEPRLSVLRE